jgi:hypothetical protein
VALSRDRMTTPMKTDFSPLLVGLAIFTGHAGQPVPASGESAAVFGRSRCMIESPVAFFLLLFRVLVALGPQALNFFLARRDSLFPGAPLVIGGVSRERLEQTSGLPGVVGRRATGSKAGR